MRTAMAILIAAAPVLATLGGCVAPPPYGGPGYGVGDSQARANRFLELSAMQGLPPPSVTNVAAPGNGNVPVTVVVFDEQGLFASGSARPVPGAGRLFDVVADAMRRDVPGVQLTLLGHTDAVGTDALNDALSLRRAQAVLGALQVRGIDGAQLSTVAIGRRQPLAPNSNEAGRARNRRVEFLVSASGDANLEVIGQRPVQLAWLSLGRGYQAAPSTSVAVMRPSGGPSDVSEAPLQKSKELVLRPPS